MNIIIFIITSMFFIACEGIPSDSNDNIDDNTYIVHKNISTTTFWVGEDASNQNGHIPNLASAWDGKWMLNYGGVDTPDNRDGYYPAGFTPNENPFYFALPYNDLDNIGHTKTDIETYIPWATSSENSDTSVCKNRWIKITKGTLTAYAQWEDVGPFSGDDKNYVFGTASPQTTINNNVGLDVSPAVKYYLNISDVDNTDWQFIDEQDVPEGPWKVIVTNSKSS